MRPDPSSAPGSDPAARPDPAAIGTRPEFARALTALRETAGLTVRDVARAVGMPDSTVGGYFSGRHLPPIKPPELLRQLLGACGVTAEPAVEEWTAALRRVRRAPGRRPAGAPVPYRGLASFGTADAVWFHGREALVEVLVDRVRQAAGEGGLVPVVGPSGSGKSSLLAAGLVPALGDGRARVLATSPAAGPPPVATRGDVLLVDQAEEVFTAYDEDGGRRYLDRLVAAARGGAVVVLGLRADFYPQALGHPELAAALQDRQVVVGPMTSEELRRAIVRPALTARLDVEDGLVELLLRDLRPPGAGAAAHDPGALPLLSHTLLTMWSSGQRRRLTLADYQRAGGVDGAVARTAEEVYAGLDPAGRLLARGLFGRLVHLRDDAAVTRRRVPRTELPPGPGPATVLNRFVEQRLVTVDADSVEVSHEALLWAWPRLREWIEADRAGLHTHRRLTEAAAAWLDSGRDEAALYQGTRLAAAREWAEAPGRPPHLNPAEAGFLAASVEHERRERGAARRRTHRLYQLLAAVTVLLLVTGVLAGYAFRQRGVVARERDLALSRQVATLADQLRDRDPSLAMQLSLVAYRVAPTVEATSSLLGSTATGSAGRLLSPAAVLQAVAFSPDGRTMAAAGAQGTVRLWSVPDRGSPRPLRTLTGHTGTVYALAFSPDGRRLASGGDDRTVRIWDLTTPAAGPPGAATPSRSGNPSAGPSGGASGAPAGSSGGPIAGGPEGTVYSLAFAPDGRTLAAGGSDRTIRLWRVGARLTPYGSPLPADGAVQAVAFAPGGGLLAAGTYAGTVRLWRTGRPAPAGAPLKTGTGHIFTVAFAPDGRTLAASGTDRTVHLWGVDPAGRTTMRRSLTGPGSWVNSLAFGSGGVLAGASSDGRTWIWDASTGQVDGTLPHPAPVTAAVFRPGGTILATAATDGVLRLWTVPGPVLPGARDSVFSVTFGRAGGELAVGSADDSVQLWDLDDPARPVRLGRAAGGPATGASAVSRDGRQLAVGGEDGTVWLWDLRDPRRPVLRPAALTGLAGTVQSVAFSPDGRLLAASSNDHTVRLWDVSDPAAPRPHGPVLRGGNYLYSVVFAGRDDLVAAAGADGTVGVWDLSADPPVVATIAASATYEFAVAVSPDGRTLAAAGGDNTVRLWDLADPHHPRRVGPALTGPSNYVNALDFGPGNQLAAGSGDGTVWLWDAADPARPVLRATLTGPVGAVFAVGFRPAGDLLAASGADRTVRLWSTDPAGAARRVCAVAGDPITRDEWARYVPGMDYTPPCPGTG